MRTYDVELQQDTTVYYTVRVQIEDDELDEEEAMEQAQDFAQIEMSSEFVSCDFETPEGVEFQLDENSWEAESVERAEEASQ